jgi:hypothetical protein
MAHCKTSAGATVLEVHVQDTKNTMLTALKQGITHVLLYFFILRRFALLRISLIHAMCSSSTKALCSSYHPSSIRNSLRLIPNVYVSPSSVVIFFSNLPTTFDVVCFVPFFIVFDPYKSPEKVLLK